MGRKIIDLTGKKFGKLTVIKMSGRNKWGNSLWLCRCECGKKTIVVDCNLKSGSIKGCGCLWKKHGYCVNGSSRLYQIWADMIQRCTNPNIKHYNRYGGRGITVCQRWLKFKNFLNDMGEPPKKHSIDRIDNNKGYYKENCRWVTTKQQNRNSRHNKLITFQGRTQCLIEWAEELGIQPRTLCARLTDYRWTVERALTEPVKQYAKRR